MNLFNILRLRIIRLDPSFLDLVNTPGTNILFSVIFALATMCFILSNTTTFFNSYFCKYGNTHSEFDFRVSDRSSFSPFEVFPYKILKIFP